MLVQSLWCRDEMLIGHVEVARKMMERMKGLLGRSSLGDGRAMLIMRCGSIHTIGMRFSIDVVFIARSGEIKRIVRGLPAGRFYSGCFGASMTLEFEAGCLPRSLAVGDVVTFR